MATRVLPTASAEPFKVWGKILLPSSFNLKTKNNEKENSFQKKEK
jgi:hypothetical protein